jgi:Ca2+-binding RTX toxin-like protein
MVHDRQEIRPEEGRMRLKRAMTLAGTAAALLLLAATGSVQAGGGISLKYTVQADPTPDDPVDDGALCEPTKTTAKVARGFRAIYCYEITNASGATLTRHDLDDSVNGKILEDFPFALTDGASAFITHFPVVTETTESTAVWTAGGATRVETSVPESVKVKVLTCPGEKKDMRAHVIGTDEFDSLEAPDEGAVMCGLGDRDDLFGGDGNDLLIGGKGKDTMIGGAGNDTCFVEKKDLVVDCEKKKKA